MKLKALIVAGLVALFAPIAASAGTITATTGQSSTYTYGVLKSSEASAAYTNGTSTQVALSGSLVTSCTSNCVGDSGNLTKTTTVTKFSTSDVLKTSFTGTQSSYDTSCYASLETVY